MTYALRSVPGFHSTTAGIQLAAQTNDGASDEDLQFMQQLGVEWTMVGVEEDENQNAGYYKQLKARFAEYGLQIYRISNNSVHNMPEVTLNLPGRDEKIEEFAKTYLDTGDPSNLIEGMELYIEHVKAHLWKENNRLFMMADARLQAYGKQVEEALQKTEDIKLAELGKTRNYYEKLVENLDNSLDGM